MFKEKSSFKYLLYLLQNIEPKSSLSEMPVAVATYSHLSLYLSLSFFLKIYQDGYTNKKYLCRPRPKAQILKIYQLYRRVVQHKVKDIQYISYMPFTYFSNIYITFCKHRFNWKVQRTPYFKPVFSNISDKEYDAGLCRREFLYFLFEILYGLTVTGFSAGECLVSRYLHK